MKRSSFWPLDFELMVTPLIFPPVILKVEWCVSVRPGLDAKLQALFHFTSSILHRLRWSSTAIFKIREAPSFLVIIE